MATEKELFLSYLKETSRRVEQWPEWKKTSSAPVSSSRQVNVSSHAYRTPLKAQTK